MLKRLPLPENVKTRRAARTGLDLALLLGLLLPSAAHMWQGLVLDNSGVRRVCLLCSSSCPLSLDSCRCPGAGGARAALWLGVYGLLLFVLWARGEALRRRGLVPTARSARRALRSGALPWGLLALRYLRRAAFYRAAVAGFAALWCELFPGYWTG